MTIHRRLTSLPSGQLIITGLMNTCHSYASATQPIIVKCTGAGFNESAKAALPIKK